MNNELLKRVIIQAIMKTAERLFRETGESFYYFTLITSGEAHAPIVSAWSKEKLAMVPEAERQTVKWSYADSPYFDFNSAGFEQVRVLFSQRPNILTLSEPLRSLEYKERLSTMEAALLAVDAAGTFGQGVERTKIVINVEVMPPDHSNTERAMRLNPPAALTEWLDEAAE
jgi:hypothetical protein